MLRRPLRARRKVGEANFTYGNVREDSAAESMLSQALIDRFFWQVQSHAIQSEWQPERSSAQLTGAMGDGRSRRRKH